MQLDSFMKLILIATILGVAVAYCPIVTLKYKNRIFSPLAFSASSTPSTALVDEDLSDPYGDLLNLNVQVDAAKDGLLFGEYSIDEARDKNTVKIKTSNSDIQLKKKDYLEKIFDEIVGPRSNDTWWEQSEQQVKDIIEQRRGYAIWSNKSKKTLKSDYKRSRGLKLPEAVAKVVLAVYVDKTHTFGQLRKENKYLCVQFRKWIRDQSKNKAAKVSPLIRAKLEVVKSWITRPPVGMYVQDQPPVVMDELVKPLYGVTFGSGSAKAPAVPVKNPFLTTVHSPGVVTKSMSYWDKSREELVQEKAFYPPIQQGDEAKDKDKLDLFEIDDVSMFVPNNCGDEFYVVM